MIPDVAASDRRNVGQHLAQCGVDLRHHRVGTIQGGAALLRPDRLGPRQCLGLLDARPVLGDGSVSRSIAHGGPR